MQPWRVLFLTIACTVSVSLGLAADTTYQVQNSGNENKTMFPELIEQSLFPDEGSESEGSLATTTNIAIMENLSGTTTTTVTPSQNVTTKPTWIQRIPKRNPKPIGQ